MSKVYEECLYKQMTKFFKKKYPDTSVVLGKVLILNTIEEWRKALDNGHCFRALLTDLSKALLSTVFPVVYMTS